MSFMNPLRMGVCLDSLALPLRQGLQEIERLGVTGVQVNAVGDLTPRTLSQTGRREVRHLLRPHNLELTALGCPLRHGLDVAEGQEARIEHIQEVLSLSSERGPRIVLIEAGPIPEDPYSPRARLLTEALQTLGRHGERTGAVLALRTGFESGQILRQFLDRFDGGGLGVNLAPAALLINGFDPYESTRALPGRVVYAQAKDARQGSANRGGQPVPLGHGNIDWRNYLSVLEEIGYHGWLTIEQDVGDQRLKDILASVGFLRRLLGVG
jgi:L-ribulose-5-phosphate 3-epimerase